MIKRPVCEIMLIPNNSLLTPNNRATFKVTEIPFLSHSDTQFELQQIFLTLSTCLNALSCCHVIGR